MKDRKLTKGGFEDIYPQTVEEILSNPNPDELAVRAGLTRNQWKCISYYLDDPSFESITNETGIARCNIYQCLGQGFAKLERSRLMGGDIE